MSDNRFRLPRNVIPVHYDLHLEPDVDTFTFQGSVSIRLGITETLNEIILNSAEIDIKSVVLRGQGSDIQITDITHDDEYDRATLTLASAATPGTYDLEISYAGLINDQLRGLYRSIYRDKDGAEHVIATSQCQSTDARRIFPCWDEPDMKATFKTTMVVADGLEAYSNGAEVSRTKLEDGRVRFEFTPTMKMSTYLLAFIVGPFEATEPVVARGIPIRIIVPKGNLHLTEVALENAVFCFEYLSDYYGIPYPGDKLDHIAIPDFAAGAMENVGLITYRDAYLIFDRAKASQGELQACLDVIGHEIAHQWFGNLVTMKWWEGAWLNEAFASFMELKATDAMKPEWKRWLAFNNLEIPWAMGTDQLVTTRPIEFEVNSPTEVDEMFDSITYGKGSAVLRMIEQFIGEEEFRTGVGNYLRKHEYANTVTSDLWEGLDGASDWPVGEIMNTWVYQRGFPQIDVRVVPEGIELSQHRYLAIPDESDTTVWDVPVQLRGVIAGQPFEKKVLLTADETVIPLESAVDYVIANAGGHGFYRSRYSEDLFASLLHHLDTLDDIERYSLVSDTWAMVRSSQVPASDFLDLVGKFGDETEHAIWSVIVGGLAALRHHALAPETRPAFESFVRDLVTPALSRLGWEGAVDESDLTRKLRGDLIVALGNLGNDPDTVARARQVAAQVLDGVDLDPEVSTAALSVYSHHGDAKEYEALWSAYQGTSAPTEKVRFLRSVAGVGVEDLAVSTVDKIVEGDVRTQDGFWVLARLLSGEAGPAVWQSARTRWERILEAMPGMTRPRVVEGLPALSQPEVAADVRGFFAEHPIPEATRALSQKLELLDANVLLRERETPVVTNYFAPLT
ncbi:MAG TPA: M1 family metallopeptidase [Acidimicrobiia bacterium]